MFQTISLGSSLGKSWKTLLRHLPFTKVQLSVLIIIGFFGGNCRTFQATGKTNGVFSLQDRRQIEETASWIRYMKTGPPLKEIFYVYLLFVVPVKRNFLLLIFMFYCYSQTIKFNWSKRLRMYGKDNIHLIKKQDNTEVSHYQYYHIRELSRWL